MITPEKAAWLAERRQFVTASDCAALLDESPYKTRAQLVMEKIGLADEFTGNESTELGMAFEAGVFDVARSRWGWNVLPNGLALAVDRQCPRLAATPDALMVTPWGVAVIQVKWTTCRAREDCEPFTKKGKPSEAAYLQGAPIQHQIQCQAEMACTGAVGAVLLVVHTAPPHMKLRPYFIPRHEMAIARIRREVTKFWDEIESNMPEMTGGITR
jgi:hypothetical protein